MSKLSRSPQSKFSAARKIRHKVQRTAMPNMARSPMRGGIRF